MMNIRLVVLIIVLLKPLGILRSQSFDLIKDIPFTIEQTVLTNPLAGGMNAPQLSKADFNRDGEEDLFIFDRVGNVSMVFLAEQTAGGLTYKEAPEFSRNLPGLINWVLLRDYNRDDIPDIFAFSDVPGVAGVMVYKGYYEVDTLKFDRYNVDRTFNVLHFPLTGGGNIQVPLFVNNVDYPSVDDIDGDGDLDILTFDVAGSNIEFYANQAIEDDLPLDTIVFELADNCWGGIFEDGFTNAVSLSDQPGGCANRFDDVEFRHAGSTLMTFDPDNDGDKELVLGDITFAQVNLLINAGDSQKAWINDQDPNYPSDNTQVDIAFFPAVFHLDVDGDNLGDILAAPNASLGIEDQEVLWYYHNTGEYELQLIQKDFLVEEMVDLGTGAHPVFVDANADGLQDIVIGNESAFVAVGNQTASLWLFLNVGDAQNPAFRLANKDYLNLQRFNDLILGYTPIFEDLDNDGDVDLLMGNNAGTLLFGENIAGPNQPIDLANPTLDYMNIDVGGASVPGIVDYNKDGLKDLIIGERNGNVNYFENKGTLENPQFAEVPENPFWGSIDARNPGFINGYSHPRIVEGRTDTLLLIGTESGEIERYQLGGGETFDLINDQYGGVKDGGRASFDLADINGDGLLEMVVGNLRGGITMYQTDVAQSPLTSTKNQMAENFALTLFPNPSQGAFRLSWNKPLTQHSILRIWNSKGQQIHQRKLDEKGLTSLNMTMTYLDPGMYWITINTPTGMLSQKMIITTREER